MIFDSINNYLSLDFLPLTSYDNVETLSRIWSLLWPGCHLSASQADESALFHSNVFTDMGLTVGCTVVVSTTPLVSVTSQQEGSWFEPQSVELACVGSLQVLHPKTCICKLTPGVNVSVYGCLSLCGLVGL